jgi:hypothetical protein
MAKNLQQKLDKSDVLFVQDINAEAMQRFVDEAAKSGTGAAVKIAKTPGEAAEGSVRNEYLRYLKQSLIAIGNGGLLPT